MKAKSTQTQKRKTRGDISLAFVAFIVTGTLLISSITGLSQFITVKNKIDDSLFEAEKAAMVYIRDNLTNSRYRQDPIGSLIVLAQARDVAVSRAIASLGPQTRRFLESRNGKNLVGIYNTENTYIKPEGESIFLQIGVSANVMGAVPFKYQNKTPRRVIRPSSLNYVLDDKPEIDCNEGNDCGPCGMCETTIGICLPNFKIPKANGDPVFGPFMDPDDVGADGRYACKDFRNSLEGEFCQEIGWNILEEAGKEGCVDPTGKCKYLENYYAWNLTGQADATGQAMWWWEGRLVGSTPADEEEVTIKEIQYKKDLSFPFGVNINEDGNATHAICFDESPQQRRKIFVTSDSYPGNLVQEAQDRGLGFFNFGIDAADALCQQSAAQANLEGTYQAVISDSRKGINAFERLLSDDLLELVDETAVNDKKDEDLWQGPLNDRLIRAIDLDQFGNPIKVFNYPINTNTLREVNSTVWTGSEPFGGARAKDCEGWTSSTARPDEPGEGENFSEYAAYGVTTPVFSPTFSPFHPIGTGWITFGELGCQYFRALYCVELIE